MKLDLGCGTTRIDGYTPWDWSTNNDVQFLPFADGSIEEIRASHVLEHIERPYLLEVVQHWVDKLQPGGILRIAVPDFDEIIRLAALDRDQEDQSGKPFPWEAYIMGGQTDTFDQHHTLWNDPKLRSLFNQVGITEILPWKNSEPIDCSDLPVSLNLAGRKPYAVGELTQPPKYPDIRGVMTMPRLTWTDTMFCCQKITSALGIEITNSSGVFYGQGMQRILSMHSQNPDIKWALTIDYDSLFDWKDVTCHGRDRRAGRARCARSAAVRS
jgi:predicted SAM-dependent methyltransferase